MTHPPVFLLRRACSRGPRAGLLVAAAVIVALLAPQPADARSRRRGGRGPTPMADLDVRTVVSNLHAGHLLRAIVGVEEIYQYLVVERIRRGATEGDRDELAVQERVDKFVVGGRTRAFPSAPSITRLRWQGQVLRFTLSDGRRFWSCLMSAGKRASFLPRCDAIGRGEAGRAVEPFAAPPAVGRRAPRVSWGSDPAVVKACGRNFTGSKAKNACLKVASRAAANPTRMIDACGKVMTGSKGKINCLVISLKADRDRSGALFACNKAVVGSKNRLACFKIAVRTAWAPGPTIRACGRAVTGGRNVLSCLMAAKDAAEDPSRAIDACKQTMTGSRNVIKCVGNAARR